MTADELQRVVLLLANVHPTRYFLHWNYPNRSPWVMAVKVYPTKGNPGVTEPLIGALAKYGLEWDEDDRTFYADRTHEDGSPYG